MAVINQATYRGGQQGLSPAISWREGDGNEEGYTGEFESVQCDRLRDVVPRAVADFQKLSDEMN